MLEFFRKYQRFFFLIITIVIIISFSFFGTYSTLNTHPAFEATVFTAVDGQNVKRPELDEMAMFLSTDHEDKLLFGGAWGPNFFNDGVIKKDFLQTGMAQILAQSYASDLKADLQPRLDKEKHDVLYTHPQGKFVSVANAWAYFSPEMKGYYDNLRAKGDASSADAIQARVQLFLAEKEFPASTLRQVLRYQQRQYNWLLPDENLERMDLSLFGYHTVEDWFGPRFIRVVSQFIINAAKIAEQQGYVVTKDEALADLIRNARVSFEQNKNSPYLGLASSDEYFQEQLRRMGMDQTKAIKVWQQVLLFRRLFHDFGNSALVEAFGYNKLLDYTQEFIEGDLYRMPKELQLAKYRDLQKLELYLDAVAKRPGDEKGLLNLPTEFLSPAEVAKSYPELVQKRYLLEIATVDKKALQTKVGIKDTWEWEVSDKNWETLKQNFPELGIKKGDTRDARFAALESLDSATRAKVDTFARLAIVEENPNWLTQALAQSQGKVVNVGLRQKGGVLPVPGWDKPEQLEALLDRAPVGQETAELNQITGDQRHYSRIRVVARAPEEEILTFADASRDGTLDKLLDQQLEAYYREVREKSPAQYQRADKSWKDFAEVSDLVADQYFAKVLRQIKEDAKVQGQAPQTLTGDSAASYRLASYARQVRDQITKDPAKALNVWYRDVNEEKQGTDALAIGPTLKNQWMLEKVPQHFERGSKKAEAAEIPEVFSLTIQEWSPVHVLPNGDVVFFQLKQKGNAANQQVVTEKMLQAHQVLSADAQRTLMYEVLGEIKSKGAISLDYLKKHEES